MLKEVLSQIMEMMNTMIDDTTYVSFEDNWELYNRYTQFKEVKRTELLDEVEQLEQDNLKTHRPLYKKDELEELKKCINDRFKALDEKFAVEDFYRVVFRKWLR